MIEEEIQRQLELTGANYRLDSVTLRGIGSYFHEARLEIRPITILCGQNGSGKSTWFKILRVLRESSLNVLFPISLDPELLPVISGHHTLVNASILEASATNWDDYAREEK